MPAVEGGGSAERDGATGEPKIDVELLRAIKHLLTPAVEGDGSTD